MPNATSLEVIRGVFDRGAAQAARCFEGFFVAEPDGLRRAATKEMGVGPESPELP